MLDAQVAPYPPLREADVLWERRVWREIDLDDPLNGVIVGPAWGAQGCYGLMEVIRHGLLDEATITAYDPGPDGSDDAFTILMARVALVAWFEELGGTRTTRVARIRIKEDWIFDKERGRMEVRIIGIAPMIEELGREEEVRGYLPIFWLYFPECRSLFGRWSAFLDGVDGSVRSYEAVFAERRFTSSIIKVSNVMDRSPSDSHLGLDALLESEGVRDQLLQLGFDLWSY